MLTRASTRPVSLASSPRGRSTMSSRPSGGRRGGRAISIAGSRHAMGGQQFGTDNASSGHALDDTRSWTSTGSAGSSTSRPASSGPSSSMASSRSRAAPRAVGYPPEADRVRPPDASAARWPSNVHGRGLTQRPIVADVESFTSSTPTARCTRSTGRADPELFRLVIGGYGLFGVVTRSRLRLAPRQDPAPRRHARSRSTS